MRILIVTDAWLPQINGVVRTMRAIAREAEARGHDVVFLTPEGRKTWTLPSYPEIALARVSAAGMAREIDARSPDSIHIATEGPLGWAARRACLDRRVPFTTSFHTRFPDYARKRIPLPGVSAAAWALLRAFHGPSSAVMAPALSIALELENRGFANVKVWSRGVDRDVFRPMARDGIGAARPILLYAGRLAVEKGIDDFVALRNPGTKVFVGDGPERGRLQCLAPDAIFTGYLHGEDYARCLAAADVMVFPSRTDTFGLVMVEAMACGTPVAAYNVAGPADVVRDGVTGCLDGDLERAVARALRLDRAKVAEASRGFSWRRAADQFISWLTPAIASPETAEENVGVLRCLHLR
jgi:glycosyltransferase involved in cell wall biosynthesis